MKISDLWIWPTLFHFEIYSTKTDIFGNCSQVLSLQHYPKFLIYINEKNVHIIGTSFMFFDDYFCTSS
jgi:hypothetical protein